jgi:DNA-binding beta-propeller fold protein YncE
MMRFFIRGAVALVLTTALGAGTLEAQANALWYIGTYSDHLLVWDEASEQIVDQIELNHALPYRITLSAHRDRLYVTEARTETIEIVDVETRQVIDEFTLSEGNVMVRISGIAPHPSGERIALFVKRYTKHRDRFEVEGPFILEYDLTSKTVSDTIPWPDGGERENVGLAYSPDGRTLYLSATDIIAVDADTFEEVDRWEISEALEPGLGRQSFGVAPGTYDEDGVVTSLLRMTDPVQNRRMMGIARARLSEKEIDFYTLGTAEPVGQFALAPDGEKAYALFDEIGRYEFWEFDLVNRRVARRVPFTGRPRMGLQVSADGKKLYIHVAGNSIDIYDSGTFEYLRSIVFDEDMTKVAVIPQRDGTP